MSLIPAQVQVRPGTEDDLDTLTQIHHHYVRETALTFDSVPFIGRLLVAQDVRTGDNAPEVLGYATSSPFRPKAAYRPGPEA